VGGKNPLPSYIHEGPDSSGAYVSKEKVEKEVASERASALSSDTESVQGSLGAGGICILKTASHRGGERPGGLKKRDKRLRPGGVLKGDVPSSSDLWRDREAFVFNIRSLTKEKKKKKISASWYCQVSLKEQPVPQSNKEDEVPSLLKQQLFINEKECRR